MRCPSTDCGFGSGIRWIEQTLYFSNLKKPPYFDQNSHVESLGAVEFWQGQLLVHTASVGLRLVSQIHCGLWQCKICVCVYVFEPFLLVVFKGNQPDTTHPSLAHILVHLQIGRFPCQQSALDRMRFVARLKLIEFLADLEHAPVTGSCLMFTLRDYRVAD